jgi:hypothetical protein
MSSINQKEGTKGSSSSKKPAKSSLSEPRKKSHEVQMASNSSAGTEAAGKGK